MHIESQSYWRDSMGNIVSETSVIAEMAMNKRGIYVLNGYSNCGKTRLLKKLREALPELFCCSYESVANLMIGFCKGKSTEPVADRMERILSNFEYLAIEDVDYLHHKPMTVKIMMDVLQRLASDHLVIITGNQMDILVPDIFNLNDAFFYHVCR